MMKFDFGFCSVYYVCMALPLQPDARWAKHFQQARCLALVSDHLGLGMGVFWLSCGQALAQDPSSRIWLIDGANRFDPFVLSRLSRMWGVPPSHWLKRIALSRSFTCFQLLTTLRERLLPRLHRQSPALVLGLGLLTALYDEDVKLSDARPLFVSLLDAIDQLKSLTQVVLIETRADALTGPRAQFLPQLLERCDTIVSAEMTADGKLQLQEF